MASDYLGAVAALRFCADEGNVDLSKEDIAFLMGNKLWAADQRNRAARCIQAFAYGAVDLLGLPRMPLPGEFVAATIVRCVHPMNYLTACAVMAGAQWSEDILTGRSGGIRAEELLAMVVKVNGGQHEIVQKAEAVEKAKAKAAA